MKQKHIDNENWVLEGTAESLKESLRKYPTEDDLCKEHNEYWKFKIYK